MPQEKMIDFKIIKEDWGVYRLKDGTIFKNKGVPIFFIDHGEKDGFGNPLYEFLQQNVAGVYTPLEKRGTPSSPIPPSEIPKHVIEQDIEFEILNEPWNEYSLEDGLTIRIKMNLISLAKTSVIDARGQSLYLINAQPTYKVSKTASP